MGERSLVFPVEEYRRRILALQEGMARAGLDALLLTTAADVFYVTGFLTRFWESPARPWFVIVPAGGGPIAVVPTIGAALMRRTWVDDIHVWDAPDPQDDGVSLLVSVLTATVPACGRVGLPMGPETHLRMPLSDYGRVGRLIAPRLLEDATDVVRAVRMVKSEAELRRIAAACRIADAAFARVPALVDERRTLADVSRAFQMALLAEGADWVAYLASSAGPEGYSDVISPPDDRALAAGDVLMLDAGAVRDGYFCDLDRNFAIAAASDGVRRTHAKLHAATEAALAAMRPGMRACDAHRTLAAALRAQGATPCGGRLGHGLGITLTEWPSLTPKDGTLLREGMVLAIEPAAEVVSGRILVHEENIVLRGDGPELLSSRTPAELPVIGA